MMYEDFFSERLAGLRTAKGVSARDMSLSIGQSANYINKIENQKAYPSMTAFFYICEYLGITPKDFFDEGNAHPEQLASCWRT
jgi:transcriptional regulator with XRE-family HTH domain